MRLCTASQTQILQFKNRINSIPETDIAWFSGWLCADGSIIKADNFFRPRLRVVICDKDPLDQMSRLFGGCVGGPFKATGLGVKARYEWSISGWKAVPVIQRCMPWLSERYRHRAEILLSKFSAIEHGGKKLTPGVVLKILDGLKKGYGSGRILAKRYRVHPATICAIKQGRIWIEPPLPKRIYILGKMTGLPYFGFPAFDEARDSLNAIGGFEVISPADLDRQTGFDATKLPSNFNWFKPPKTFNLSETIRKDINTVLTVDCYTALNNWRKSKGARAEKALCDWRGIPRIDWKTGKKYE